MDACSEASLITLGQAVQDEPITHQYDGSTSTFTFTRYTVSPGWCDMSITCDSVVGPSQYLQCQDLDNLDQIKWTFDRDDYEGGLTPGSYVYTYNVSIGGNVLRQFTV